MINNHKFISISTALNALRVLRILSLWNLIIIINV